MCLTCILFVTYIFAVKYNTYKYETLRYYHELHNNYQLRHLYYMKIIIIILVRSFGI